MDPSQLFADSRLSGFCVYCGGAPDTRDHVPSRILLDDPFPGNLPVVECCCTCNTGFSGHEEYFACFLSCVINGSTSPEKVERPKIARILRERPSLAARIQASLIPSPGNELVWNPEVESIRTILLKLARGHIAYELSLPRLEEPAFINFAPLQVMSSDAVASFLAPQSTPFWPEIGSRAFFRACKSNETDLEDPWIVVQPGRYQYLVSQAHGDFVRIVIGDYLACEVQWD
jgi:hypothetical protein